MNPGSTFMGLALSMQLPRSHFGSSRANASVHTARGSGRSGEVGRLPGEVLQRGQRAPPGRLAEDTGGRPGLLVGVRSGGLVLQKIVRMSNLS